MTIQEITASIPELFFKRVKQRRKQKRSEKMQIPQEYEV